MMMLATADTMGVPPAHVCRHIGDRHRHARHLILLRLWPDFVRRNGRAIIISAESIFSVCRIIADRRGSA